MFTPSANCSDRVLSEKCADYILNGVFRVEFDIGM